MRKSRTAAKPARHSAEDMRTPCSINQELLKDVSAKLAELHALMKSLQHAGNGGNGSSRSELTRQIETAFKEKDRAVEAWTRHHQEHGC